MSVRKRRNRIKKTHFEIAPDEIFLDDSNASDFDRDRFEGRIEKPLPRTTFFVLAGVCVVLLVGFLVRAGNLELVEGKAYADESAQNSLTEAVLPAPRGVIEDANGVVLAHNVLQKDGSVSRVYTLPAMGQIIGYVSRANSSTTNDTAHGAAGLEAEYDAMLSGTNGEVLTERDALGNVRSEGAITPAVPGKDLQLSINANLEALFSKALAHVATTQDFVAGGGVIMNIHTGAVEALASYPSYDPNVMASGGPASDIASYTTNAGHPFLDHATQGIYAPGSIVKPFVAAGALTDGIITPKTIIDDTGLITIPDPYHPGQVFAYHGWKAGGLGPLDVESAIAWSSDIFFYTVGGGFGSQNGLGIDRLDYWYRQFGFGSTTGIDLPLEVPGVVPTPAWKQATFNEPWYLGDTYFTAIGQYSMEVTPIQMARATAAIANGGTLLTPTLLADQAPEGTTVPVSQDALSVVRSGMRLGVTSALADAINLPYLSVAAKTGTAQVGVNNEYDNAWVVGFFPYENPQYAFSVVLERGPSGEGEEAVNVMEELFDDLHEENSPIIGGTGTSTDVIPK